MKDINKIIDSLSPGEQNVMYNALQKRLNRGPEYTIRKNCTEQFILGKSLKLQKMRYLLSILVIIYFMEVQKIFLYTLIRKLRMF